METKDIRLFGSEARRPCVDNGDDRIHRVPLNNDSTSSLTWKRDLNVGASRWRADLVHTSPIQLSVVQHSPLVHARSGTGFTRLYLGNAHLATLTFQRNQRRYACCKRASWWAVNRGTHFSPSNGLDFRWFPHALPFSHPAVSLRRSFGNFRERYYSAERER